MPPFNPTILIACKEVPKQVREYVDPHITHDDFGGYDVEINPNHPTIKALENNHKIEQFLRQEGFKNATIYYQGPGRGETPDLSGIIGLPGDAEELMKMMQIYEVAGGSGLHINIDMERPEPGNKKPSSGDQHNKRKKSKGFG